MKPKHTIYLLLTVILLPVLQGCTNASAGDMRGNLEKWVSNLLTPSKTTLEKSETGYQISGNLKNKPKNLILMWEMRDELFLLDSVRTDASGNFTFKGNIKEPVFVMLQWNDASSLYLFIDNKSNGKLEINPDDGSYSIQGKGMDQSLELKELVDLNTSFNVQFNNLQQRMNNMPNTPEGYSEVAKLQESYNELLSKRTADILTFAYKKTKSLLPYFIIRYRVIDNPDLKLLQHALNEAKKFSSTSKYTADMQQRYNEESKLAIGAVAPDIKLPQPNGDTLSLSSLRGKVVLIDFWASWCRPCRAENPNNVKLYKKWHSKGFDIFAVSLDDDPNRWKGAIAADSLVWNHVSDLRGWGCVPAKAYHVSGIPNTVLIDAQGRIIAKGLRGEQLSAKLEELLGKQN